MNSKAFQSALAKTLYPVLRAEGFAGSGKTLRRLNGPVIHVFNLQGGSGGDRCYVNLGAHLSFLPTEGGSHVEPGAMMEYHCAFRGRIDSPSGLGWAYGRTMEEVGESVEFIVEAWGLQGRPFFQRYARWPDSLTARLKEAEESDIHPIDCLTFARIAIELGQIDRAVGLARRGLDKAGERATDLRGNLNCLITRAVSPPPTTRGAE